ncbi:MAG: carboxylesterase family protein, partial [Planctomycetota bacterium]
SDERRADLRIRVAHRVLEVTETTLPELGPLSSRKMGFRIAGPAPAEPGPFELELTLVDDGGVLDTAGLTIHARAAGDLHQRTFRSGIDGSVQYYAVRPAASGGERSQPPALVLSLHGAGVPGRRQASCYRSRDWCHVVAPTNRRPYGFDWEDWGRLDALEVLGLAQGRYGADPARTYVTGHSMGGHGTWHLGVTYPDRFAAIAPSAGWISFWSYAGAERFEDATPIERMLLRSTAGSDTLSLSRNYLHQGIYVLHGDRDDNVPVQQARTMRELFEFLRENVIPAQRDVRHVEFVTASPGISASCHWVTVHQQTRAMEPSSADIALNPSERRFTGTTENVTLLALDLNALSTPEEGTVERDEDGEKSRTRVELVYVLEPGIPLAVELDGQVLNDLTWPEGDVLWLQRDEEDTWSVASAPGPTAKGPHRSGPFKDAFRHEGLFVYGTEGSPEENAWSYAKARFDAETFGYRGNASVDVIPDSAFGAAATADRSVILYGNADTNGAWTALLSESPVQVTRGQITVGQREFTGDDLAALFIRPRPGSDIASVGVVSGTGLIGTRLTDRLPYFVSGVGYPDLTVLRPDMLTTGTDGVVAAGFFGNDWSVENGDIR